jgi:hypothetical protein
MEDASMTGNNMTEAESGEAAEAQSTRAVNDRLIDKSVGRAQAEGLQALWQGVEGRRGVRGSERDGRGSGGRPRRRWGSSRVGGRN